MTVLHKSEIKINLNLLLNYFQLVNLGKIKI